MYIRHFLFDFTQNLCLHKVGLHTMTSGTNCSVLFRSDQKKTIPWHPHLSSYHNRLFQRTVRCVLETNYFEKSENPFEKSRNQKCHSFVRLRPLKPAFTQPVLVTSSICKQPCVFWLVLVERLQSRVYKAK